MVNNNKILTVSYGTFSCTLEGFDDSFDTMKAIAEYFRDLASDDRYFGAEPPQPDADMLARIAQREITRRVEAHSQDGNIVLRAKDGGTATAIAAPAAAVAPIVEDPIKNNIVAPVIEAPVVDAPVVETPVVETAEIVETPVVETPVVETPVVESSAPEDAAHVVDDEPEAPEAEIVQETPIEVADPAPEIAEQADIASDSIEDVAETTPDIAPVVEEPVAAPADDSIAAKLERIRAVVSRNEQSTDSEDYLEDEHAENAAPLPHDIHDTETPADNGLSDSFEPEILDQSEFEEEYEEDAAAPDMNMFTSDDTSSEEVDTNAANGIEDKGDEIEDSASEEKNTLRARVIKVKRTDIESAIADGALEEMDETPEADQAEGDQTEQDVLPSSLSEEDEAALQRELDEVETSIDTPDTTDSHAGAKILSDATNTDDDMSRLMAETDTQMDEPESSLRRNAFAHLRAAVAATKAEETLGDGKDKDDSSEAYRDDLASVVKPRRPEASGTRTERPADARPAPLKLVAEQRIDVDKDVAARGPVLPRRVATNDSDVDGGLKDNETSGFAEYADAMGASDLADLLEAAAAYMVFIEGRDQFSRPQLMNKVREVEKDDFSREYSLRSFGKLLRTGKIEKVKGGRFVVSDKIGFKPDPDNKRAVS